MKLALGGEIVADAVDIGRAGDHTVVPEVALGACKELKALGLQDAFFVENALLALCNKALILYRLALQAETYRKIKVFVITACGADQTFVFDPGRAVPNGQKGQFLGFFKVFNTGLCYFCKIVLKLWLCGAVDPFQAFRRKDAFFNFLYACGNKEIFCLFKIADRADAIAVLQYSLTADDHQRPVFKVKIFDAVAVASEGLVTARREARAKKSRKKTAKNK